jgi:phosphoribulokinase
MKFNDIISESVSEKDLKKADMLYNAFKKGLVIFDMETGQAVSDEAKNTAKFSYTLSDNKKIDTFIGVISIIPAKIYLKEENKQARNYYTKPVTDSIVRKFRNFGISFHVPNTVSSIDVEPYKDPTK